MKKEQTNTNTQIQLLLARWSFLITPINYNLAGANVFVALTNIYQLSRVFSSSMSKGADKGLATLTEQ